MLAKKLSSKGSAIAATIQYIGAATAVSNSSTAASYTVNLSGLGLQQGDLLVAFSGWAGSVSSAYDILSSGWTSLTGTGIYVNSTGVDLNYCVLYKIMGATPDTSFTSDSIPNNSYGKATIILAFRGVDQTTPFDVPIITSNGTGTGVPLSVVSITPITSGSIIVVNGTGTDGVTPSVLIAPSNTTSRSAISGTGGTGGYNTTSATAAWSGGSFTPGTWSGGDTSNGRAWVLSLLALRPATL